jgi:hypothetical protein
MDDYKLDSKPFFTDPQSSVSLFTGFSHSRNNLPVLIKRYDFASLQLKSTQENMSNVLNCALTQAKASNSHTCEILEVQVEAKANHCAVFVVLETGGCAVGKDIEEKMRGSQPYSEEELRTFLSQIGGALAAAHSKRLPHREVKLSNVFRTANEYKLGHFSTFCNRKEPPSSNSFQEDVLSLGNILYDMATVAMPAKQARESRDKIRVIDDVKYSNELKSLLKAMLASPDERPTMEEVCRTFGSRVVPDVQPEQPNRHITREAVEIKEIVSLSSNRVKVFNLDQLSWESTSLKCEIAVDVGSRYVWTTETSFVCCGGWGDGHKGRAEAYLLTRRNWQVTGLAAMRTGRSEHGLWWDSTQRAVLVFGGSGQIANEQSVGDLAVCEAMKLGNSAWEELPAMQEARSRFNPCAFSDYLYLCGWGSDLIEAYSLENSTFQSCSARLPEKFSPCCVFIEGNHLAVISGRFLTKWKSGEKQLLVQESIQRRPEHLGALNLRCNMAPIVEASSGVIFLSYNGFCMNVKTNDLSTRVIGI